MTIDAWIKNVTDALPSMDLTLADDYLDLSDQGADSEQDGLYTRQRPLMTTMAVS